MTALTETAGYPVHRVVSFRRWTSQHGVSFTRWTAACGAHRNDSGHGPFGKAGNARRLELCPDCFPGRDASGYFPDPVEESP